MKIVHDPFLIENFDHRKSFRNDQWETVLVEPGDRIYRIYTPLETSVTESPFWFEEQTYQRLKRSAGDEFLSQLSTRALLAVRFDWSRRMNRLITAIVDKPFLAGYGPVKFQNWSDTVARVTFIGGAYQLYILPGDKAKITVIRDTEITPEANVATRIKF